MRGLKLRSKAVPQSFNGVTFPSKSCFTFCNLLLLLQVEKGTLTQCSVLAPNLLERASLLVLFPPFLEGLIGVSTRASEKLHWGAAASVITIFTHAACNSTGIFPASGVWDGRYTTTLRAKTEGCTEDAVHKCALHACRTGT